MLPTKKESSSSATKEPPTRKLKLKYDGSKMDFIMKFDPSMIEFVQILLAFHIPIIFARKLTNTDKTIASGADLFIAEYRRLDLETTMFMKYYRALQWKVVLESSQMTDDILVYMEKIADQVEILIKTYNHLRIGAWKDFFNRIPNGCIASKQLEITWHDNNNQFHVSCQGIHFS